MGIQINGQTDRISAVDGSFSIQDLAEVNVTGVATASNFKSGTSNVHSTGYECTNINATGIVTAASANFTGNVSVGGTLTYQDVTNIDSIGIITARAGVDVNNGHIVLDSGYSLQWSDSHERIEQSDGKLEFFTNNTEKVTISGGNLGIGDVSPTYELEVASSDTTTLNITAGGNTNISRLFFSDGDAVARGYLNYNHNGDNLIIGTAGAEKLRITSAGNVGIGTDAPADILHLRNNAPVITTEATNASSGLRVNVLGQTSATSQIFRVQNDNSTLFTILKSGDMGLGVTPIAPGNTALHIGETTSGDPVRLHMTTANTGHTASDGFTLSIDGSSSAVNLIQRENADIQIYTNNAEKLRIESGGDVSIGGMDANTFSNYTTLTIGGAGAVTGSGIDFERSDGNIYGRIFGDANGLQIGALQSGDYIRFETANGTERARIDNDGMIVNNGYRISTTSGGGSFSNPYSLGALASATIPSYPHFTGTWVVMGSVPCNNTWHDLLHSINDSNGLFHGYCGDASSKNIFQYQYSLTSPAYGVNNLSQRFMNGAWNTGSVSFQLRNNNGPWTLQIKATSHYSSSNNAGFRIMFHSYY